MCLLYMVWVLVGLQIEGVMADSSSLIVESKWSIVYLSSGSRSRRWPQSKVE
jgi:hypothetical protein